jgi:phage terminase Nu1 subunit (DNA packaging protein)
VAQRVTDREANRKQTGAFFGVSVTTVDNWVSRGCPSEKRGKFMMFYLPDVVEWREHRKTQGNCDQVKAENENKEGLYFPYACHQNMRRLRDALRVYQPQGPVSGVLPEG